MWPDKFQLGSWVDCLDAIEKEVSTLKDILSNRPHDSEFSRKMASHDVRSRFDDIWRYAGMAVKDLERQ